MSELLRCPFCGGEAEQKLHDSDGDWWRVRCAGKDCSVWPSTDIHQTLEAAEEIWNTRVQVPKAPCPLWTADREAVEQWIEQFRLGIGTSHWRLNSGIAMNVALYVQWLQGKA